MQVCWLNYEMDFTKVSSEISEILGKDNTVGMADFAERKIYVAADQSLDEKKSTWLHELIEVVNDTFNIKLKEEQICSLEKGLHYTLKDRIEYPNF